MLRPITNQDRGRAMARALRQLKVRITEGQRQHIAASTPRTEGYWAQCHLCHKIKQSPNEMQSLYLLAFHYDRRHRGWTDEHSDGTADG